MVTTDINLHGSPWNLPTSATEVLLQIDTGEAYVYVNGVLAHAGRNNTGIGNYYGPLPLTIYQLWLSLSCWQRWKSY